MKRFITEYAEGEVIYSGAVDALDWEHAQILCDQRGMGETVEGVLCLVIRGYTQEQADAMCRRFAESDEEPPDSEYFL